MQVTTTKAEAIAQGLKTYFTGTPCRYGHLADRRVDSGACCECRREKDRLRYARKAIHRPTSRAADQPDQGPFTSGQSVEEIRDSLADHLQSLEPNQFLVTLIRDIRRHARHIIRRSRNLPAIQEEPEEEDPESSREGNPGLLSRPFA